MARCGYNSPDLRRQPRRLANKQTAMPHTQTIYSWNVNGVRAVAARGQLAWLHERGADVLALQETKTHPDKLSAALHRPDGYHSEWCAGDVAH